MSKKLNIWFPTIRTNSGSDIYTIRLCSALRKIGINAEITWFPHYSEILPFLINTSPPTNCDIIHANSWSAFAFSKLGIPLVTTLHHNVLDPSFLPYKTTLQGLYHNQLIQRYEKRSLDKASTNIAVSDYTAVSYSKTFNIRLPKVIPNWVDTSIFTPPRTHKTNNVFKLLFIGNHTLRKGADLLLPIMERLGKGYELHTTGGLRNRPSYQTSSFIDHGHIPRTSELVKLYQSCDALLFPSRLEGFGLAALEAQACGLPVISTNSSALPEVIKNAITGNLCPTDDINAFVSAIHQLKNNSEKTKTMSLSAREHVLNSFSEQIITPKYLSLYESLLR